MTSHNEFPKLRWPIDIQMHQAEGERFLVLRCPVGVTEKPLILVSGVAPLIGQFEGNKSIAQIEAEFSQHGVTRHLLEELVSLLDSHYFLANERFFSAQEKLKIDFLNSPVRPAALAGASYTDVPTQLSAEMDRYLSMPLQAGFTMPEIKRGKLAVLVAPHIDYRRGGSCYGRAFQQMRTEPADLYIVIGTSHQYSSLIFHLTKKDFVTPLGRLPCDQFFVEKLAQQYGSQRSFADELLHRREHSLELQLPFLSTIRPGASIVPILVGGFNLMVASGKLPNEFAEYDEFAAALAATIQETIKAGKSVMFIAGVDMAHVGRHFGDPDSLTPDFMQTIAQRDLEYLNIIGKQDKTALFNHIAEDADARKICGFPTMYTILDVADRLGWRFEATVFDYQQAVDYHSDCAVTFAGMGLYLK